MIFSLSLVTTTSIQKQFTYTLKAVCYGGGLQKFSIQLSSQHTIESVHITTLSFSPYKPMTRMTGLKKLCTSCTSLQVLTVCLAQSICINWLSARALQQAMINVLLVHLQLGLMCPSGFLNVRTSRNCMGFCTYYKTACCKGGSSSFIHEHGAKCSARPEHYSEIENFTHSPDLLAHAQPAT